MPKKNEILKLTDEALKEYPEYRGAVLKFVRKKLIKEAKWEGWLVRISQKRPYTEVWDKNWFK